VISFLPAVYQFAKIYWRVFKPQTQGTKVVIRHGSQTLLIKNSYAKRNWTLPGGGVKDNETPEQAAKREVGEEVGIGLRNLKSHGSFYYDGEGKRDTIWVFSGEAETKNFKIDHFEISKAQWFDQKALPKLESKVAKTCLKVAGII
jgi:8-oxo-dGTP pyrophosphatase MutT (NUDIX family)